MTSITIIFSIIHFKDAVGYGLSNAFLTGSYWSLTTPEVSIFSTLRKQELKLREAGDILEATQPRGTLLSLTLHPLVILLH